MLYFLRFEKFFAVFILLIFIFSYAVANISVVFASFHDFTETILESYEISYENQWSDGKLWKYEIKKSPSGRTFMTRIAEIDPKTLKIIPGSTEKIMLENSAKVKEAQRIKELSQKELIKKEIEEARLRMAERERLGIKTSEPTMFQTQNFSPEEMKEMYRLIDAKKPVKFSPVSEEMMITEEVLSSGRIVKFIRYGTILLVVIPLIKAGIKTGMDVYNAEDGSRIVVLKSSACDYFTVAIEESILGLGTLGGNLLFDLSVDFLQSLETSRDLKRLSGQKLIEDEKKCLDRLMAPLREKFLKREITRDEYFNVLLNEKPKYVKICRGAVSF